MAEHADCHPNASISRNQLFQLSAVPYLTLHAKVRKRRITTDQRGRHEAADKASAIGAGCDSTKGHSKSLSVAGTRLTRRTGQLP